MIIDFTDEQMELLLKTLAEAHIIACIKEEENVMQHLNDLIQKLHDELKDNDKSNIFYKVYRMDVR